jgi:hypothetical protein
MRVIPWKDKFSTPIFVKSPVGMLNPGLTDVIKAGWDGQHSITKFLITALIHKLKFCLVIITESPRPASAAASPAALTVTHFITKCNENSLIEWS